MKYHGRKRKKQTNKQTYEGRKKEKKDKGKKIEEIRRKCTFMN